MARSSPRPVIAKDNSVVLIFGGRSRNGDWMSEVANPATLECNKAIPSIRRTPEDIANGIAPTISGGVGTTFNEDPVSSSQSQSVNYLRILKASV